MELSVEDIEQILHVLEHGRWGYLRLERGDLRITWAHPPAIAHPVAPATDPAGAGRALTITAPAVGWFYRGGQADAPALVQAGQAVPAQTPVGAVAQVEGSVPVVAPDAGRVEAFVAESGAFVEYGQALVILRVP